MSKTGKVRIRVEVPEEDYPDLRSIAGKNGMSMSAYCMAVILEAVRKEHMIQVPKKKGK